MRKQRVSEILSELRKDSKDISQLSLLIHRNIGSMFCRKWVGSFWDMCVGNFRNHAFTLLSFPFFGCYNRARIFMLQNRFSIRMLEMVENGGRI